MTRPKMNTANEGAIAVMKRPTAKMRLEKTKQRRGVKIAERRPASGVMLEDAIFKKLGCGPYHFPIL